MEITTKALLVLEDGKVFKGSAFGAESEAMGEVVFNTSMFDYQEILTDPSYERQMVVMTYPLIGNDGFNDDDFESENLWVQGFIVREYSKFCSNWRATNTLDELLKKYNIIGIQGIDTRALTRHIRLQGALKGVISTSSNNITDLVEKARNSPGVVGQDLVKEVSCQNSWWWKKEGNCKVVVVDCGVKYNILRELERLNCKVQIVPAKTNAENILERKLNETLFSKGPGDPSAISYVIDTAKKLIGRIPIFGICLGQQVLAQALGGKTYKLKFGHHGGNHPTKDLKTGKISITVQNHNFCVDINSLPDKIKVTHINLYDNSLEGIECLELSFFSVQFHPESSPGPCDTKHIFKRFLKIMEKST